MKISLVMPLFNEAELIEEYIYSIRTEVLKSQLDIIIVNDNSKDDSQKILEELMLKGQINQVMKNEMNLGHGPSVLNGLRCALLGNPERVITLDSDGQISASELSRFIEFSESSSCLIVEGVRERANEPWFRKAVSHLTRLIVLAKTGNLPRDANTPLRSYRPEVLPKLLDELTIEPKVPNLQISILTRRHELSLDEFSVVSKQRNGKSTVGTTWNTRRRLIPSKKFIEFCADSFIEVLRA